MTTVLNFSNAVTEKYSDHPLVAVIVDCMNRAVENVSDMPDTVLTIPGMSGRQYRRFINNYMRHFALPSYLEVGVWQGSTLCSAIAGIDHVRAVGVDNFTYGGATWDDVQRNVNSVRTATADVTILNQNFEDFDFTEFGKFNVYCYDGEHTEHDQYQGIVRAVPALEDVALVVVDDWNDRDRVEVGTLRGFNDTNLEIIFKITIDTGENPGTNVSNWHNGYGIFLVKKT